MMKGLAHFNQRQLTLRHFKLLLAVELLIRVTKGKRHPNASMIGQAVGLKASEFERELNELCEYRYLHAKVETYSSSVDPVTYKIGAMGGTLMRAMLPKKPLSAFPQFSP